MNRTRRLLFAGSLLAGSLLAATTGARAGDPAPDRENEIWLHDVAALAAGSNNFRIDRGPWIGVLDSVNDEEKPLYGGEGQEPFRPFGSAEDLMELAKTSAPPEAFGAEGVRLFVADQRELVVRAPRPVQEAIANLLAELAREAFTTVTYDVVALTGDAAAAGGEGGLAAAVASKALFPLASARTSGFLGQDVTGRQGGVAAFLQGQYVEVADESATTDPIVSRLADGLAFRASASAATPARVRLQVNAWWAAPTPRASGKSVGGDLIEMAGVEGRSVDAEVEAKPGSWTLLPATGPIVFAVRATVRPYEAKTTLEGALLPAGSWGSPGTSSQRRYDLRDLLARAKNEAGRVADLYVSNYTPLEPAELPEPSFALPFHENLKSTIRQLVEPPDGSEDDASYSVHEGFLFVQGDEIRQRRVEQLLAAFRARYLRGVRLRATVVRLPIASLPEYWTGLEDGASLLAEGGAALLARPGAGVIDRAGLRQMPGQRTAAVGGVERQFVSDYDVEIAKKVSMGKPTLRSVFEGLSVDVRSTPLPGVRGTCCEVRVDLSAVRGTRKVPTRHGEIECPSLGYLRVRGATVLPYGSTRLLACNVEGKDATLVLLTANPD